LKRCLRVNLLGPGLRLIKKNNLPGSGLTKVEKHCFRRSEMNAKRERCFCTYICPNAWLLIRYFAFVRCWRKSGNAMTHYISYFRLQKVYGAVRREICSKAVNCFFLIWKLTSYNVPSVRLHRRYLPITDRHGPGCVRYLPTGVNKWQTCVIIAMLTRRAVSCSSVNWPLKFSKKPAAWVWRWRQTLWTSIKHFFLKIRNSVLFSYLQHF
jgi:hypothetical protein